MNQLVELKERLRRKTFEGDGPHGTWEVLINPDGPEAATAITDLEALVGDRP